MNKKLQIPALFSLILISIGVYIRYSYLGIAIDDPTLKYLLAALAVFVLIFGIFKYIKEKSLAVVILIMLYGSMLSSKEYLLLDDNYRDSILMIVGLIWSLGSFLTFVFIIGDSALEKWENFIDD